MDGGDTGGRDGHLVVYLAWPLLAGLGLGLVLALCMSIAFALAGSDWRTACQAFGWAFIGTCVVVTVGTFLYAAREWAGPRRIERIEQARQEVIEVLPEEWERPPPMIVRGFSPGRALPATVDLSVEAVGPVADPEIKRLYNFIVDCWRADDVSQEGVMSRGWRRRDWDQYVGGSRRRSDLGTESGRGLLDRAGIVCKDGSRWAICATLDQALQINEDLLLYASERAQLVRLDQTDKSRPVRDFRFSGD